jgi:hypothetical protein
VAHINHDEHRSGSLEVGRDGDLTVLDRDLLAAPAEEVREASVAATVIGGQVLYAAGAA